MIAAEQPVHAGSDPDMDESHSPTMSDVLCLVERTGARDLVLSWALRARLLESTGQRCETLRELAGVDGLQAARSSDATAPAKRRGHDHGHARRRRRWRARTRARASTAAVPNQRGV